MKTWMLVLAFVATFAMSGLADAKVAKAGKGHGHGIHGKIQSVDATSFTIATGGKKNPKTLTINFTATTSVTIDGVAGGKIDASLVGKYAKVVGTETNGAVDATQVMISSHPSHHKKPTTKA